MTTTIQLIDELIGAAARNDAGRMSELRHELIRKVCLCPRCHRGIDDDEDGNCAMCDRLSDEELVKRGWAERQEDQ